MANKRFIDFPIAASVGDNDIVLIWQDGLNKQTTKATLFAGSPNSLAGLTDVDISALTNGQILQYNSTTSKWENVDRTDIDLDQLGDVTIVSPTNGQVLVYNSSTSKWENSSAGFVPYTGAVTTVNLGAQSILAGSFVKAGGTSAQFLKADGSVDSNTYLTTGSAAATYVPYTGATADVNLGTHDLTAERGTFENNGSSNTLTVNHTSGSGYGIIVTKGGNNEALYVSKTSGSGNAMTVVGGRTSLVDLALSSVTNTAGDFLTLSGGVVHKRTAAEVRTDIGAGTVTSVAALTLGTSGTDLSSTVANGTTTPVITLNVPTASASNRGALSSADWTTFNNKQAAGNYVTTDTTQTITGLKTLSNSSSVKLTLSGGSIQNGILYSAVSSAPQYYLGSGSSLFTGSDFGFIILDVDAGRGVLYDNKNTGELRLSAPTFQSFDVNSSSRMAIFNDGNVSINNSPSNAGFKLDVNGTGRFSSSLTTLTLKSNAGTKAVFETTRVFGTNRNFQIAVDEYVEGEFTITPSTTLGGSVYTTPIFILAAAGAATFSSSITATSIIRSGGISTQFLKADGSVDSTTYVPVGRTITINGTSQDLSANRTFNVGTVTSVTATAGTGISISGSPITTSGTLTITNTAPDQVVSLTASTGISISGTYPNFTITNTSPSSGGTIISVTASSPLFSSGGTTPNITIQQASGSQNGFLSSTDWTTFNNKQNSLTLTTSGTSGVATLVGSTLNIPNYGSGLSGYLPLTGGTLTGSLGGTSASFNSTVTATEFFVNTSGQSRAISTFQPTGAIGQNIWIGGGGANSTLGGGSSALASQNTSLGVLALTTNTTGRQNVGIGYVSLNANTTGFGNTSVGAFSMSSNSTGYINSAFGYASLGNNTTAFGNAAFGNDSLGFITTGRENTAIGNQAGLYINAGTNNGTSEYSVYVGADTRASANGNTNEIVIGFGGRGQGSNSAVIGNTSITKTILRGNVLIGTETATIGSQSRLQVIGPEAGPTFKNETSGQQSLFLWNAVSSGNNLFVEFGTDTSVSVKGSIDFNRAAGLIRYNVTSDKNLKNIIGDSDRKKSIDILNNTRIREYSWKDDELNKPQIGVIAQELYETYKGAVRVGSDKELLGTEDYKPWGVDKTAFTFHLVAGFQEHERIIKELKQEIYNLKNN
jgi:hypothetical protein